MSQSESLWKAALLSLPEDDQLKLSSLSGTKHKILNEVQVLVQEKQNKCIEKRWKFVNRKGNVIVIRDLFEKIARSVKYFADTVDIVVQYDPVHTVLPWVGVRLFLQVAIGDIETWALMVESIERITHMIARYAMVEAIWAINNSTLPSQLAPILTDLYSSILQFLIKANEYFSKSTITRHIGSIVNVVEKSLSNNFNNIMRKDQEAQAILRLLETEKNKASQDAILSKLNTLQSIEGSLGSLRSDFERAKHDSDSLRTHNQIETTAKLDEITLKLQEMRIAMEQPLVRLTSRLKEEEDHVDRQTRLEVLHWLSRIPYRRHHSNMASDMLHESGTWLEQSEAFTNWRNSSSSSVLWLHGIPGSGKSKLVAHVVDLLVKDASSTQAAAPIAYFYCARATAEQERANPVAVLRAVLKQISRSNSDEPLPTSILDVFRERKRNAEEDGSELEPLSFQECVDLILQFAKETSINIVIDALDECDPERRYLLLNALETIVAESDNLVKIFISSRDDADIVMRLSNTPNIYITASNNAHDIERFALSEVENAIKEKRLLHGQVPASIKETIISKVIGRADGMFLSVKLQIQALCNHRRVELDNDVWQELERSPASLHQLWSEALDRVLAMASSSRKAALAVVKWIFYARVVLPCQEIIHAIRQLADVELKVHEVLNVSNNLVVYDAEMDTFRFAHLSVREFLEGVESFAEAQTQPLIAYSCLRQSLDMMDKNSRGGEKQANNSYSTYASVHWPIHCYLSGAQLSSDAGLASLLKQFLIPPPLGSQSTFGHWLDFVSRLPTSVIEERFKSLFRQSLNTFSHPIFLVVAWDFRELLDHIWSPEVNQHSLVNQFHLTALALACNLGRFEIANWLIEKGSPIDVMDINQRKIRKWKDGIWCTNPLAAAIQHGHPQLIHTLLAAGASHTLPGQNYFTRCILDVAAQVGDVSTVKELLLRGADPDGYPESPAKPLLSAVRCRHPELVHTLLRAGANPNVQGGSSDYIKHPLEQACSSGELNIAEDLLNHGADMEAVTAFWGTPLASAARLRREEVVEMLLQKGADPNLPSGPDGSAFFSAVAGGSVKIVSAMLQSGVDVNLPAAVSEGNALSIAMNHENVDVLRLLLEHGADPLSKFTYRTVQYDATTFAAADDAPEIVSILLQSLKQRDLSPNLSRMLMSALRGERTSNALALLDAGADVNEVDENGSTPLSCAVLSASFHIVTELLSLGADVNAIDKEYGSVLQVLCSRNTDSSLRVLRNEERDKTGEIFQLLIDRGASFNLGGGRHHSFLQSAAYEDHPYFITKALECGVVAKTGAGKCGGPYHAAASRGHLKALNALLASDLDVNISCPPFGTAMAAAACGGRFPASKTLQYWSYMDETERKEYFRAFRRDTYRARTKSDEYLAIVEILIAHGARVDCAGGYFGNALQAAAYVGNDRLVERLIGADADPGIVDGFYGTALQAAAAAETELPAAAATDAELWLIYPYTRFPNDAESVMMQREELTEEPYDHHLASVKTLLKAGAEVNTRAGFFGSALQAAVHSDNVSIVKTILAAGADVKEDGTGFYGGCISAAISFGKAKMMRLDPLEGNPNAEEILTEILTYLPIVEYSLACQDAYRRALERENEIGLSLLLKIVPVVAAKRGIELDGIFQ